MTRAVNTKAKCSWRAGERTISVFVIGTIRLGATNSRPPMTPKVCISARIVLKVRAMTRPMSKVAFAAAMIIGSFGPRSVSPI